MSFALVPEAVLSTLVPLSREVRQGGRVAVR
jgi:hypothetical protein